MIERTADELRQLIKEARKETYKWHAFTPEWNAAARILWAHEDQLELVLQAVQAVQAERCERCLP